MGVTSESAAHRVAVEWDTPDGPGVRSRLSVLVGGRLFPGWHHLARFQVEEGERRYRVELQSRDGEWDVAVVAHRSDDVMAGSVFATVDDASAFFRCAPVGYAATPAAGVFDGVTLTADRWAIAPLQLEQVQSSWFDRFPKGSAVPDSAFLMADLATTWKPEPALVARRPD